MSIKFINLNCIEGDNIDLRQAKAVLRHKPDIIVLEYPSNNKFPSDVKTTPKEILNEKNIKAMPWIRSDIMMWKNIEILKKSGHEFSVYKIDGPNDLVNEYFIVWQNMHPCALKNWFWWVQVFLREQYMAKNLRWILNKHQDNKDLKVLVFLQSFHWTHVKFVLNKPTRKKLWQYYFGKFKEVAPKNITEKIKKENKIFYKHWKRFL